MKKRSLVNGLIIIIASVIIASCGKKGNECKTNADCPSGEICIAGSCESPEKCSKDSDCESGYVCLNNICIPKEAGKCNTDSDCPPNYTCENKNGICVTPQDTTPPETTITSYPKNPTNSTSATFEFTCDEENCTFECKLDNGAYSSCSSPKTYINLSEGLHIFYVRAKDSAGNTDPTPASYSWTIDITPPETTITSYPQNPTNSTSGTFEFICNEASCTFQCKIDNGSWESCSSPKTYTNLSDGSHTFEVRAIDSAGNIDKTPATYSWTIDSIPPETTITSYPQNPTNSSLATFEFTCDEGNCVFECKVDNGAYSSCSSPKTFTNLSEGLHIFYLRAKDSAGNTDPTPASYSWTIDITPPETTITSQPPNPSNSTLSVFEFTCNEEPCTFECRLDNGGWVSCTSPKIYSGLSDGSHTFEVRAIDSAGNVASNPALYSWTVNLIDTWHWEVSPTNPPSARVGHTAVWTGNEMIVWGGLGGDNTGGRYDPSTDSWTPTSTTNAPSRRYNHTAVWTGSEMIVWGGFYYDGGPHYLNTGGRYNPSTDSWTPTTTIGAPSGREEHTAVWTGNEMIVWGGFYGGGLNTGGRYDPSTDSWTPTSTINAPAGRYWHTAVWTGQEMIIWGGGNDKGDLNTGGRYNPSTDSWIPTSTTNAPAGRAFHTAVWTGSEMIVWGGYDSNYFCLDTGGRYNPSTDSWIPTSTTNAPAGRTHHTAVWTGTEMIVWGGWDNYGAINTGGRYNPSIDSWTATSTTNAPSARNGHTAVWTGSEMIIWGGYYGDDTGGRYNPSTDSWIPTSTTNAPAGREAHTAVWTGQEMIIWGGYNDRGYLNTGGRYDPSTDSWIPISTINAPSARIRYTAVWTGIEMIVWGGSDGDNYFNTGGRYNPSIDSWTATSTTNAPSARNGHTAVWTGSEMIVWGGYYYDGTSSYFFNTGGRYNPSTNTWKPTATTDAPSARVGHTAVWTGSEMIVWGGNDDTGRYLNTGGRYNPSTDSWTPTTTIGAPSGREGHTAVWTGQEMIIWGGYNDRGYLNTGGRYDSSTDTWKSTSIVDVILKSDDFETGDFHNLPWVTGGDNSWYVQSAVKYSGNYSAESGTIAGNQSSYLEITLTFDEPGMIYFYRKSSCESNCGFLSFQIDGVQQAGWGGEIDWTESGYEYPAGTHTFRWEYKKYGTGGSGSDKAWIDNIRWVKGAPSARVGHTAVWTGSEMIVWGGSYGYEPCNLNTGGRYNPSTDSWVATSIINAPAARTWHTAVWTGAEMIVWGGWGGFYLNSIGRYTP